MSSVDVAIGVVEGKVVASWHAPLTEISFDPQNAYLIGVSLSKAALEAHRGSPDTGSKDLMFIAEELASQKVEVTDLQRQAMVNKVTSILQGLKNRPTAYQAVHCVDAVLQETAR